jgi:DNA-binding MarR family transcriptional regulator
MNNNQLQQLNLAQRSDSNQKLADDIITLLRLVFMASRHQELYHKPLPRSHNHQFHVLYVLHYSGESNITMSTLAEALGASNQNTSKVVTTLEEKGYVKRERCITNRRRVYVHITAQGIDYLEKCQHELRDWLHIETTFLEPTEQEQLQQSISTFLEIIERKLQLHQKFGYQQDES